LAVKKIQMDRVTDKRFTKRLYREITNHSAMDHPNIVRLRDVFVDDESRVCLVMERCQGGEVFDFINKFIISEEHIKTIVRQVLLAVEYMHSCNVVHRDLKPENLMLVKPFATNQELLIKVIDFGFSRQIPQDNTKMLTACGSSDYVAPEILTGKGYGAECDLWSVGVINYVLFCSTAPFSGDTPADTCKNVAKGVYTYPDSVGVSQEAKAFISGLLEKDATKRLTPTQALESSWLQSAARHPRGRPQKPCINAEMPPQPQGKSSRWIRPFQARAGSSPDLDVWG